MKLILKKGLSYNGHGVKVTNLKPLVENADAALVAKLLKSGYFAEVPETPADKVPTGGNVKPVDKMTEKELDAYAAENGIDLTGVSGKAKKLEKIQQALAETDDEGDGDGEVDFEETE